MLTDKYGKVLTGDEIMQKGVRRVGSVAMDLALMFLRWVGYIPFYSVRQLFYQGAGIKIGRGSAIHMWANFYNSANISIGEDTVIGDHVFLDGRAQLTIGNHVALASSVMVYNAEHQVDDPEFKAIEEPVIIEDYVFVGPRAIILPGVTIGRGAVVAAGAVVTKDVPPMTVVGGVPAREIRKRQIKELNYRLGRARLFQ